MAQKTKARQKWWWTTKHHPSEPKTLPSYRHWEPIATTEFQPGMTTTITNQTITFRTTRKDKYRNTKTRRKKQSTTLPTLKAGELRQILAYEEPMEKTKFDFTGMKRAEEKTSQNKYRNLLKESREKKKFDKSCWKLKLLNRKYCTGKINGAKISPVSIAVSNNFVHETANGNNANLFKAQRKLSSWTFLRNRNPAELTTFEKVNQKEMTHLSESIWSISAILCQPRTKPSSQI